MSLTQISAWLIVGGLVWLGAEFKEDRDHPSRHKVPAESELTTVSGEAMSARVVEHKTKQGVVGSRYFELDIQGPEKVVTVRVQPQYENALKGLSEQIVTAKFDSADEMIVYDLSTEDDTVLSYAETSAYKAKLVEGNSGGYIWGWIVVALGIAGLWLGRKPANET